MELIQARSVAHGIGQPTRIRVVLLPGAWHTHEQFLEAGFDQAVRSRALPLELILAAPRLAHLTDRRWIEALHDQVVAPARAHGGSVWLGGISLGGFMALRFAAQYPQAIDGLCLLAPYLGSRIVAAEFDAQTDITDGQGHPVDDNDDERRIWQYVATLKQRMTATRIFLGLSRDDRFADTQQVLSRALPPVGTTLRMMDGTHDWPAWRRMWDAFLQMSSDEIGAA